MAGTAEAEEEEESTLFSIYRRGQKGKDGSFFIGDANPISKEMSVGGARTYVENESEEQ